MIAYTGRLQKATLISVLTLSVSAAGLTFLQKQEGVELNAYKDAVGIPTICSGHTERVFLGSTATLAQCEELLKEDATYAGAGIKRYTTHKLTQAQYDALVSFVFNVGAGNYAKSTLLRKINAGDCKGAGTEFLRWDKAGGRRLAGLTKRRVAESQQFLKDCDVW